MSKMPDWVKQKLPDKVFRESGEDCYLLQDWDTPPDDPALAMDKRNWGGVRVHIPLQALDALFGSQWPEVIPFAGKPAVHAKLNNAAAEPDTQPYQAVFDEWKARGLIN